jgi:hypothetical protein
MEDPKSEIPPSRRHNLVCYAWLATVVLTFPGIFYFQCFPAGLFRLFGMRENDVIGHSWLAMGWLLYVVLTVAACLTRRKRAYFIVYTVLCVLLALNTIGCRCFWSDLSHVH